MTDPSLTDYARFYGLTTNHLEVDPLAGLLISESAHIDLEDGPNLFKLDEAKAEVPREKLYVGRDEALLLGSLTESLEHNSFEGVELDPHRIRNIKQELPMLRTDHETDMREFAPPLVPDLANEHLPLEMLDEEADEGLSWPSEYAALPDKYFDTCRAEKLEISITLLDYMRDLMSCDKIAVDHSSFEVEEIPRKKVQVTRHSCALVQNTDSKHQKLAMEPMTPPMLPFSPTVLPYEPSSDTGHLELLSEPISPTLQELKEVERDILGKDSLEKSKITHHLDSQETNPMLFDLESLGELYSPLKGVHETPPSPQIRKTPLADLKVEVPLTPPQSEKPAPWQRPHTSVQEAMRQVMPSLPSPIARPEDISSEDIDAFFEENIAPIAVKAERSIEQEQLQEVDTTHRVPVPVMDFSLPLAPWKAPSMHLGTKNQSQNTKERLLEMKKTHFSKHYWPGVGETERSLQWMPFPAALGRVETYESIGDDNLTEDYLSIPERVDSSTLTWKPEGLRLFDEMGDSDEEELKDGIFPEAKDIESLVKKRKVMLDYENHECAEEDGDQSPWLATTKLNPVNHEAFRKVPKLSPRMASRSGQAKHPQRTPSERGEVLEKPFSAVASLETFMSLRDKGATNSKLTAEHHFPKQGQHAKAKDVMPKGQNLALSATESSHPKPLRLPHAAPQFTAPPYPCPIVVSTSFLRDRNLFRHIQRLLPLAEFVERDFILRAAPRQNTPKTVTLHSSGTESTADEADMILSPSTGLIITTLQKIKQRSLPGQATRSALHERVAQTAPRYERLIILIRNDRAGNPGFGQPEASTDPPSLDSNDCEALVEFTAFCTAYLEETQIILTDSDTEHLAQWIASLVAKHCIQNSGLKLLHEETLWEIFLRRAGLNAFAAQVVLSELKAPPESETEMLGEEERAEKYGLSAFVRMSERERLSRFEVLLGGGRVLGRVSRVLDARW